jgi:hypothetical protein
VPVARTTSTSRRRRSLAFAVLAAACFVAAGVSVSIAVVGAHRQRAAGDRAVADARPQAQRVLGGRTPYVVFRSVDRSHPATFGRLAVAPLRGTTPGTPALAGPACDRAGFAADRGICLDVQGSQMGVTILDAHLRTLHRLLLAGIPSRARVSPDGRWGGVTAFLLGHAYASPGQFSTAATIIDLRTGRVVGDLEKGFSVYRDGKLVDAVDRNYWGLTFADDDDTFYATLATHGRTWLIKGSIRARRAHTIHANVECPSLSPDGTRIGYKKAVAHNPTVWRFTVLDLATGHETPLAETRSIDDQLAWLNDRQLLYGDKQRTWVVNADGSGAPKPWLAAADSATVVRR